MKGLTKSSENQISHFVAEQVDKAVDQFSKDLEENFFEVDDLWLNTQEQMVSNDRQLAPAMVSEGPTAEELSAIREFMVEER
ncbi:hypothetical protein PF008_g32235 [Phytophthora fragariae]|uniref:Uncharacterized protein n=1 Tax=Phytophthora fragariae TaxID=53985 RepID=A0A6G0Q0D0_9STRA|nr:hypothetical protein PF008_g32235 [Phytophthora fragariae]